MQWDTKLHTPNIKKQEWMNPGASLGCFEIVYVNARKTKSYTMYVLHGRRIYKILFLKFG
jgi:hypothetical protein